jgi:hypothetical protein
MGVFVLWVVACCAPMPVAPIELKEKLDALVFDVTIHLMTVFCNELSVVIEGMSNPYTPINEELT